MPRFASSRRARVRRRRPLAAEQLEPRLAMAMIDPIFVPVGEPRNAADPLTGFGRVEHSFRISKYEVTIGEYAAFLNAVASEDTHQLYNAQMFEDETAAGIERLGSSPGFTYKVVGPAGITPAGATTATERPIAYVDWFDAARFANWMANGQPTGPQDETTTENGAYDLTALEPGRVPARNTVNTNTGSAPTFFLPSENEWYKAAYYDPDRRGGRGGYSLYATRSDAVPGNVIGDAANQVNYIFSTGAMTVTQEPLIDPTQNYLTAVGAMRASPSAYGTFDQNGNVWELMESAGTSGGVVTLRGGGWTSFSSYLASNYRLFVSSVGVGSNAGFRLAATAVAAAPVVVDLVTVGDAGNAADAATGFGAVASDYAIGRTDVTIAQYVGFLNAVARTDTHGLFDKRMTTDLAVAGITRVGRPGRFSYSVINNGGSSANRPITYVSWFDAARFANWMANGQPTGRQNSRTTENGAYDLSRSSGRTAVPRNAVNPNTRAAPSFFIPTENEWYKAAYFTPDKNGAAGYYVYATRQDTTPPGNNPAIAGPTANYLVGPIYCITQSNVFSPTQHYLTDVGMFSASGSHYGTFDQNGLVYQWNDLDGKRAAFRGLRGGFWAGGAITLQKSTFTQVTVGRAANDTGIRLSARINAGGAS